MPLLLAITDTIIGLIILLSLIIRAILTLGLGWILPISTFMIFPINKQEMVL